MQYLKHRFTVPPATVTQAEWDRIFGKRPKRRTRPVKRQPGQAPHRKAPGATTR